MSNTTILDVDPFPIMGWAGPTGAMIRPDVMRGMAEAGFTISHSWVTGDADEVIKALDIAAAANIKLLLVHPCAQNPFLGIRLFGAPWPLPNSDRRPHPFPVDEQPCVRRNGIAVLHLCP